MKKFGKILGGIILGIVLILLAAVAILTVLEYRPDQIETLNTTSGKQSISTGDSMTILTYNMPDLAKTKISLWTAEVKSCRRRKIW